LVEEQNVKDRIIQLCALFLRELCLSLQVVELNTIAHKDMTAKDETCKHKETNIYEQRLNDLVLGLIGSGENGSSNVISSLHWNQNVLLNLYTLWGSEQIQDAYRQAPSLSAGLNNAEFFLKKLKTMASSNYKLTIDDISLAQQRRTRIHETKLFDLCGNTYSILDVTNIGGDKNKWIHSFNNADGLLLIYSLAELEDKSSLKQLLGVFSEMSSYFLGGTTKLHVCFTQTKVFFDRVQRGLLPLQNSLKGNVRNPAIIFKYIITQFMQHNGALSMEQRQSSRNSILFYAIDDVNDCGEMYLFTRSLIEGRSYFGKLISGQVERSEKNLRDNLYLSQVGKQDRFPTTSTFQTIENRMLDLSALL